MSKKQYIGFIILAIAIFGVLFYWLELRPAWIKHDCSWVQLEDGNGRFRPAIERITSQITEYEFCLHDKGL